MEIFGLHYFELFAFVFGLIYIFRAAHAHWDAWVFGIISCSLWAYVSYFQYSLFADAVLQLFYVGLAFIGLFTWRKTQEKEDDLKISFLSQRSYAQALSFLTLIAVVYGYCLSSYTEARFAYLDAFTTIYSIYATYLLTQSKMDNWYFWIVLNVLYIYIYSASGAMVFALMMLIYLLMSFYSLYRWRQIIKR